MFVSNRSSKLHKDKTPSTNLNNIVLDYRIKRYFSCTVTQEGSVSYSQNKNYIKSNIVLRPTQDVTRICSDSKDLTDKYLCSHDLSLD